MGNIYEIIAAIRNVSGKKDKRAILQAASASDLMREFMKAVYDPRIQYGITKLPKHKQLLEREFCEDDIADLVESLPSMNGGKSAKEFLSNKLGCLNEQGRELIGYIISRDVKAGIAENSVLEVWPGLFYIPPYQRCAGMDEKTKARFAEMESFFVQTKSDGQFCYAIKRRQSSKEWPVHAMSRAGSLYPQWLANFITYGMPEGYVAMGELLVVRDGKVMSRKEGNGVLNSVLSGDGSKFKDSDAVRFLAWDMVTEAEFDAGKSDLPYKERLVDLKSTSLDRIPSWKVRSVHEASVIHNQRVAEGEEGTVWKNPDMLWRDCSSGDKDMMKVKVVFEADYEIDGFYEGTGKAEGMLGGLMLKSKDGLIRFDCGSGFSDDARKALWADRVNLRGKVVTAEGNDIVESKTKATQSVFLPIFIEIRTDKTVADDHARVWAQFEAAKEGKKL